MEFLRKRPKYLDSKAPPPLLLAHIGALRRVLDACTAGSLEQ